MNYHNPLVSIIMPAYNSASFIGDSIKSVISQTYINWQLIIVNDCSSDDTLKIIQGYAKNENRIAYLNNKENLGVSLSRLNGFNHSNGDYIAFLDSDDIWKPKKLEMQLQFLINNSANFTFTGCTFINEMGKPLKGIFEVPFKVSYKRLRFNNVISCSSVLINKKLLSSTNFESKKIFHEDFSLWLKILKKTKYAYGLNYPLLIYRISLKSKSGNKIKSILMTFRVFRHLGYWIIPSLFFTLSHTFFSALKYFNIRAR